MTREEAIAELREDKALYESDICHAGDGSPDGDLLEALDMAIESLQAPTVERSKGKWVLSDNPNILYECSNCGHGFPHKRNGKSTVFYFQNFCSHCGADMRTE